MTTPAAQQAAEALRQFADPSNWSLEPGCLQWAGKRNAIEYAESILAALSAEAASVPSREAMIALAARDAAIQAAREECALIAESFAADTHLDGEIWIARRIADSIRARSAGAS